MNQQIDQLEQVLTSAKSIMQASIDERAHFAEEIQKKKNSLAAKQKELDDKEAELAKREKKLSEDLRSAELKLSKVRTDDQLTADQLELNQKSADTERKLQQATAMMGEIALREENVYKRELAVVEKEKNIVQSARLSVADSVLKSVGFAIPTQPEPSKKVQKS